MERYQRAAILVGLVEALSEHGSWSGNTHIQKATYFLQKLMGVPLGFNFVLYKYGPYSFDLSEELTALRAESMLKLLPQQAPFGPKVVPGDGAELLKASYGAAIEASRPQLQFLARELGSMRVADLERLATALYVTVEQNGHDSPSARASRVQELKPHIGEQEARDAVEAVDRMRAQALELA